MNEGLREFVDGWGAMGAIWGIGASVARVHALLLASARPLSLEDVCRSLHIAKSNASTSLKELRSYQVVRKVKLPGERREHYVSEGDPWLMLLGIARERKRREFDPALRRIHKAVSVLQRAGGDVAGARLAELEAMFTALSRFADKMLESDATARALLALAGGP